MTLTIEAVRAALIYEPETGIFRRRETKRRWKAGEIAGGLNHNGYLMVSIGPCRYFAHKIAIFLATGVMPASVDHINGDKLDNRLSNLRPCNHAQNGANMKVKVTNNSGVKGVSFDKVNCRWKASLTVNRKQITVGRFDSLEEAKAAIAVARKQHHGEFARHG